MRHQLVPPFILEQYENGRSYGQFPAATLFLDIVGFTNLTQTLMQHGKDGAEQLAQIINNLFNPIINTINNHGGFVTVFAGDALTVVFPNHTIPTLIAAASTALNIKHLFQQQNSLGHHAHLLAVKQGLAVDTVHWGIVGPQNHKSFFFRGPAIDACAHAEHQAQPADIILTTTFQQRLQHHLPTSPLNENYHYLHPPSTTHPTASQLPTKNPHTFTPTLTAPSHTQFFPQSLWLSTKQGEFRDVAILFVAFEDTHDYHTLNQFFTQIITLVDQFDGFFVEIDFGDKGGLFLVYFGAPITHEQDIERALSFVQTISTTNLPLTWRAGLTFGTVYAGYVGSSVRDKYTCMGSVVNLAARLMIQADWRQTLVSPTIANTQTFEFSFIGQIAYKGFQRPLSTYQFQGTQASQKVFYQPIVGRQLEQDQINHFIHMQLLRQQMGIILIYGETGAGKSHLAHTLQQSTPAHIRWLISQTDPVLNQAFNPFVYFLKKMFGQTSQNSPTHNYQRFEQHFQQLLSTVTDLPDLHQDLQDLQDIFAILLGHEKPDNPLHQLSPSDRYHHIRLAFKQYLHALCHHNPIILLIEDGHWLDQPSLDLLNYLAQQLAHYPLIIIITTRHQDNYNLQQQLQLSNIPFKQIDLNTLPPSALRHLAQSLLGLPIDDRLHQFLLDKTESNPFFIQQILFYLHEHNALTRITIDGQRIITIIDQSFPLPTNLNTLLIARLDRLPNHIKDIVQTAAILGREFDAHLLAFICQQDIHDALHIAEQERIWIKIRTNRYLFKHLLFRKAAYNMQLNNRRQTLHYQAAIAIRTLYLNRLPNYYSLLAYHYEAAYYLKYQPAHQAACQYLTLAGQQAAANFEHELALDYFDRALAITPTQPPEPRYHLLLLTEQTLDTLGLIDLHQERLDELLRLVDLSLDDLLPFPPANGERTAVSLPQATVALRYATFAHRQGHYHQANQLITHALNASNPQLRAQAYYQWGYNLCRLGQFNTAHQRLSAALNYAQKDKNTPLIIDIFRELGWLAFRQGQPTQATHFLHQALDYISYHDQYLNQQLLIFKGLGGAANAAGNYTQAQLSQQKALDIARQTGNRHEESSILINLGNTTQFLGDYTTAVTLYQQGRAIADKISWPLGIAISNCNLGLVLPHLGRHHDALQLTQKAFDLAQKLEAKLIESISSYHQANILTTLNLPTAARQKYHHALTGFTTLNLPHLITEAQAGLAALHWHQQQFTLARQQLQPVLDYLANDGPITGLEQPLRLYARCYKILSTVADPLAPQILHQAHTILHTQANLISDKTTRHNFLTNIPWHNFINTTYNQQ
ncbi:MAG TPA: tetratricopeptide repeat protein [Anaerolineae bacterium]|nr:tetratricopeptide repeat protein [Anaerolineae bacterium]